MKIKKYEGKTEQEVMLRVKEELGISAIILSIKRKPYRGLLSFFKKPIVVVTAAYEEKTAAEKLMEDKLAQDKRAVQEKAQSFLQPQARQKPAEQPTPPKPAPRLDARAASGSGLEVTDRVLKDVKLADQQQRIASLENKLNVTEELLEKVVTQLNIAEQMAQNNGERKYDNNIVQLFYDSLVEQGVTREIAEKLMESVDLIDDREKIDMPLIVKIVYNTIMDILGEPSLIEVNPDREDIQVVAFMGPTGVGKTTTIAKLSSILALNHHVRVGLITADTYRIAAVEQLKTYADILGLDVQVVYNNSDIENSIDQLRPMNDVILIDTAGRSHRKKETLAELKTLFDAIPESKKYLVLSITTKYEDLLTIVNAYSAVTDFNLIFTKLDETATLGSILNICYLTGKKASYVTFGQNVPDDIEVIQPEKITKSILGLGKATGNAQVHEERGSSRE